MSLVYREIDPTQLREVYAFIVRHEYSWRDSSSTYVAESEEDREKKTKDLSETLLKGDEKYHCLAVFDGDEMIAAHYLNRVRVDKLPACHVHSLWVDAKYRGQGIAQELKTRGEAWAKSKGCVMMDSNVRVTNAPMIALNKSLGYEIARYNFRKPL